MNSHHFARRPQPLWLLLLLSLLTWLSACSDSPPPAPVISVQPSDTAASAGSTATLGVTASGPDLSYQWQLSSDGGATWANLSGATQASYTTPATTLADHGRRYRVIVSASGISVTSSAVQLTVTAAVVAPTLSVQPAAQSATAPASATFSVTATGTAPAYQWQRSTDSGVTWAGIAGASAASYNTGSTDVSMNGQQWRVVVSNSAGSVTSVAVTLSVSAAPMAAAFTTQPANQSVTAGSAAAFTVAATGTPTPTLQWQRSSDGGGTWANIAAATDATYNTGPTTLAQNGERYRAVATNGAGSATSNAALLTVNPVPQAPAITTQPAAQSVTAPASATFTAAASGVPTPAWQWQLSTDSGATWANINAATAASYTTPATVVGDSGRRYRAVASNTAGMVTSNGATLTVTGVAGRAWQTAALIETDNVSDATHAQVAFDANGNALAVWQQYDNVRRNIWANRYTAGAGWGTATLIETDNAGHAFEPQVAIDGNGNAFAVWHQSDGLLDNIWANRYTAGTGWGTATLLETGNASNALRPQIAFDASGNALAVWGTSNGIGANRYTAGTGWGTATAVVGTSYGSAPQIAIDANGNALAVWVGELGGNSIWGSRFAAATLTWSPAALIETYTGGLAAEPQVAIDANGDALAVWRDWNGASYEARWNRYTASTNTWGASATLSVGSGGGGGTPQVAFDSGGNAIAVWVSDTPSQSIWSRRYVAGVGWGAAELIETDDAGAAQEPQIAIDGSGNAFAVWYQRDGTRYNIWANRYTAGTGWGTAALLETDNASNAQRPQIAFDASGNAMVVWDQRETGASVINIWARSYR